MNMNTTSLQKPTLMSDLDSWLSYLENIHPKTIELGLARVTQVANNLDVLQPAPYIFTVAGTNGKGTTCRALEMILLEAGLRVGVYSSPHLLDYTERVRINNRELAASEHVEAFAHIENNRHHTSLTYFEYSTLAALWLFKQANLDVVILEVGLGGRLDATNIVKADVAVITSIALDHMDYLGNTRESIGREKAGIFKHNCIAVVGEPDMPQSIYEMAEKCDVQLHCCAPNSQYDWHYVQIDSTTWQFKSGRRNYEQLPVANIPLANCATALAALSYSSLAISEEDIAKGLGKTQLVGRFQTISDEPTVIIDVAHNPHAANYLNNRLTTLVGNNANKPKIHIVIGMLKDKDIASTINMLQADQWYCASLYGERGAKAEDIAIHLKTKHHPSIETFSSVADAYKQAIQNANKTDIIVVCGSFHTVSEILSLVSNE